MKFSLDLSGAIKLYDSFMSAHALDNGKVFRVDRDEIIIDVFLDESVSVIRLTKK